MEPPMVACPPARFNSRAYRRKCVYTVSVDRYCPAVSEAFHATTILAVRAGGKLVVAGDGQVSLGQTVMKQKLEGVNGNLRRAAVDLAKDWRTDRMLRRLEALLVVADAESTLLISGSGDVVEPDDGIIAIGSGGNYALAAAKALAKHTSMDARAIAEEAMRIASTICVYTNEHLTFEELPA
jgi:ATP-dependent HslUV protease subunit HslV